MSAEPHRPPTATPTVAVCWKWTTPPGDEDDERRAGVSDADAAALEIGLRVADALGTAVTVVALGPPVAERGLRDALAAGATRAVRVDGATGVSSATVGRSLAGVLDGADWVVCGAHSSDRGSGSVPAFLAAELGAAQALGLIGVELASDGEGAPGAAPAVVRGVRRLDGGRRERLALAAPAVISVEGSVARLRRASLPAELAARTAPIEVRPGPGDTEAPPDRIRPFRPRPRVVPPPPGTSALERVRALTDVGTSVSHGETVTLDPEAAADRIVTALVEWGYLDPDAASGLGEEQDLAGGGR